MKQVVCALCLIACAASATAARALAQDAAPAPEASSSDPVFQRLLEPLQKECRIPLRLPRRLPDLGQGTDPVYAVLESAQPDRYSIILGFTEDCNGASFCRIGVLTGRKLAGPSRWSGKQVRLHFGLRGVYQEAECGANCTDAVIRWREGDVEYSVGVKAGSLVDAKNLANASLAKPAP
jgi:hypothetical protein